MFPPIVAEQLQNRGHDVASLHEADYRRLEGTADPEVYAVALADGRALVTENVPDFQRLQAGALGRAEPVPCLIFTTNRQFPRGRRSTVGRLVVALDALLADPPAGVTLFLEPVE